MWVGIGKRLGISPQFLNTVWWTTTPPPPHTIQPFLQNKLWAIHLVIHSLWWKAPLPPHHGYVWCCGEMPPFEWGGWGGNSPQNIQKPPPYSSTPNSTPILSLEGEGAIHHRELWNCGKMPLTPWKVHPPLPIQKIDISQVVNSKNTCIEKGGGGGIHHGSIWCCDEMPPSSPTPFKPWEGGGG